MDNDLISRSALKKAIKSYADDQYAENEYLGECSIMDIIDNAPPVPQITVFTETADEKAATDLKAELQNVLEELRPKGEWVYKEFDEETGISNSYFCSKCGYPQGQVYINFCGNCGSDMRKGRKVKLMIMLDEEKYEWIKKNNPNADINSIVGAIANGTPLPKGHDRLVEAKAVIKALFDKQTIDDVPTIIEADKEDEE